MFFIVSLDVFIPQITMAGGFECAWIFKQPRLLPWQSTCIFLTLFYYVFQLASVRLLYILIFFIFFFSNHSPTNQLHRFRDTVTFHHDGNYTALAKIDLMTVLHLTVYRFISILLCICDTLLDFLNCDHYNATC